MHLYVIFVRLINYKHQWQKHQLLLEVVRLLNSAPERLHVASNVVESTVLCEISDYAAFAFVNLQMKV